MTPVIAATLWDVLGTAVGVLLALTGLALGVMGAASAIEGTVRRGLLALGVAALLVAAGLYLAGFLA